MLATEQECSENTDARGDRIDRVSQREVCEGLQQGIVGFSFFLISNPISSTCMITFSEKQRVKGRSAVQAKSETNLPNFLCRHKLTVLNSLINVMVDENQCMLS